ncbi:MAG: LPS export ABC transporter permease LptF [Deltaproteobacteria bacterium]|nr:MAG: LPS export ABC transporter permease LptF [Deltaproteobacteria bacterium]
MKKILDVYVFKEMIPNFTTSLVVFTFLILAGRTLRLTEWMVNHGVSLAQVLLITGFTLPYVFFFTLPMATLLASLIAFSRLNEDNEITALRASGVSLYQLFPPVITFSIGIYIIASLIAIYLLPAGNHSLAKLLFEVARSNTSIGIKQGVFNETIPNIVLYANHISAQDQTMEGIYIFDERDPDLSNTIIAQQGRISSDQKQMSISLHLTDGSIFMVSKELDSSRVLQFKSYDLNIELADIMKRFSSRMKGEKEMSLSELRNRLRDLEKGTVKYNILSIELQRKFSIPLSCLLFGLIGLPLGLMVKARARSWGIALSVVVFTVYYILLSSADSLGETGTVNPVLAMWIPDMVLGVATVILIWWAARHS